MPTSNLDPRSEAKIEAALDVLLEGRTAILIAHRLSTAVKADRIVVVDEGHDEPGLRGKPRTRADLRGFGAGAGSNWTVAVVEIIVEP